MKQKTNKRLLTDFLRRSWLTMLVLFLSVPSPTFANSGSRSGSGTVYLQNGTSYYRQWYLWNDHDWGLNFNRQPTEVEYFKVTHPNVTWKEPYIEFELQLNNRLGSYAFCGCNLKIGVGTNVYTPQYISRINKCNPSDNGHRNLYSYWGGEFNFMPEILESEYGYVRIVRQTGKMSSDETLHKAPSSRVTGTFRYYPSQYAIEHGFKYLFISGEYYTEGYTYEDYLEVLYRAQFKLPTEPIAEMPKLERVGPYQLKVTAPANKTAVMATINNGNNQQYRDITYFVNGVSIEPSTSKEQTKIVSLKNPTCATLVNYKAQIIERFPFDNMVYKRGGGILTLPSSNVYQEPNGYTCQQKNEYSDYVTWSQLWSNPDFDRKDFYNLHHLLLPGIAKPSVVRARFAKWGAGCVNLTWEAPTKDKNGVPLETKGKWYIYRTEVDDHGAPKAGVKPTMIKSVNHDVHQYVDRTMDADKNYIYHVMFGADTWTKDYWKSNEEYVEELATASPIINTTPSLAISSPQVEMKAEGEDITISWTSEAIDENNLDFDVMRKIDASGTWKKVGSVTATRGDSQKKYTYTDATAHSTSSTYYYKVQAKAMNKTFESDEITTRYRGTFSIKSWVASTGIYGDRVELSCKLQRTSTDPWRINVMRRIRGGGNDDFRTIYTTTGTDSVFTYEDKTALVGDMYEYRAVLGELNESGTYQDVRDATALGFRRSTGVISGRVTFGTGVAVEDAKVKLENDTNDPLSDLGRYAMYTDTDSKGIRWGLDKAKFDDLFGAGKSFAVQLWVNPEKRDVQTPILRIGKNFLLSAKAIDDSRQVLAVQTGEQTQELDTLYMGRYNHITLSRYNDANNSRVIITTRTDDQEPLVCSDTLTIDQNTFEWQEGASLMIAGSTEATEESSTPGVAYHGYVDDIRIWNRALTEEEAGKNYDRILGGTENGLVAYWPLDENIQGHAFDISTSGGIANANNPEVDLTMQPSPNTPNTLSMYGLTDSNGNYIIRGIPYSSAGSNYIVRPEKGVHDFSPSHLTRFISAESTTSSAVDFSDVSSFPVTGNVYYEGTNFPVADVIMKVDGVPCTIDGKIVKTDDNGHFEISVPIGEHSVSVELANHKFVNEGRYPASGKMDFRRAVSGLTFEDATTVVFAGRVTGGKDEGAKPVGFGASVNTIGKAVLSLKASDMYYLNAKWNGTRYEASTQERKVESSTSDISSKSWRGKGAEDAHRIFIQTDSLTGEFSAIVPPINYTLESVVVPTNGDVVFHDLPKSIDLSKVGVQVKDSLKMPSENGDSIMHYFPYDVKLLQTFLDPNPKFVISQIDKEGSAKVGAYGIKTFTTQDGKTTYNDLWSWDEANQKVDYAVGSPLFVQNDRYEFGLEAYDEYVNNDDSSSPVTTKVPQRGVVVTVQNPLSSEQSFIVNSPYTEVTAGSIYQLKENQVRLGSDGKGTYRWTAGMPNVTSPYTRTINISGNFNGRNISAPSITGAILGGMPKGNNFVTRGPDLVVSVLRDPPGSNSYASIQKDTVRTSLNSSLDMNFHGDSAQPTYLRGAEIKTVQGFTILDETNTKFTVGENITAEGEFLYGNRLELTTTFSKTVSTSAESEYVGINGDVFVGYSTNMIVGDCRNVELVQDPDDKTLSLESRDGMAYGQEFSTEFNYSQAEIRIKQIPMWTSLRNAFLMRQQRVGSKEEAMNYVNHTKQPVYLTWLKPEDEDFGEPTSYVCKLPIDINEKAMGIDSVQYYNSQIDNWKNILALNEQDKVRAFQNPRDFFQKNLSFDAGATYSESLTVQSDSTHIFMNNARFSHCARVHTGSAWNGNGIDFVNELTNGGGYDKEEDSGKGTTHVTSYTLQDNNSYVDLTVDVYKSAFDGWGPIFRVRGGQTMCPWQMEERTQYFEPNNKSEDHILNYATQAIERPRIVCDERIKNDVTPGSTAVFKLRLSNESDIDLENDYCLKLVDNSNPTGAQVFVDGAALVKGVNIFFNSGETVEKTITIKQPDQSVTSITDLGLALVSTCQNDPSSYYGVIGDTIRLTINYQPTSSPVRLQLANTTMNTVSGSMMNFTIDSFDRTFKNFYGLRLQHRYENSALWTTDREFVVNPADSTSAGQQVIPASGAINYPIDMANFSVWPDGKYAFRVVSLVKNGSEEITRLSDEVALTKDLERPQPLGLPTPKNGILDSGEEISVTFNEDIQKGMLTNNNVVVSGVLNAQAVNHEVALKLIGSPVFTLDDYNFSGNDFTAEMWLYRKSAGQILEHGTGDDKFVASVDDDGHLVIEINDSIFTSKKTVPANKWVFLAIAFDNTTHHKVIANIAYDETTECLLQEGNLSDYKGRSNLSIGESLQGMVHEVSLWNVVREASESFEEKNMVRASKAPDLLGYWRFNEGAGMIGKDMTGRNNFFAPENSWYADNENLAVNVEENGHIEIPLNGVSMTQKDSYAVEMWVRPNLKDADTDRYIFQLGAKQDSLLAAYINPMGVLHIIHKGEDTEVNTYETLDNGSWHHLLLNVRRGISANVYVDETRYISLPERTMPSLAGRNLLLGACLSQERDERGNVLSSEYHNGLDGAFDEVRIWNANLSGDYLLSKMNERCDAKTTKGLAAYYPFEALTQNEYHQWVADFTDQDAKGSGNVAACYQTEITDDAPTVHRPERTTVLDTRFTASERQIFVTINNDLREYEGTTLNIEVSDVRDVNGNLSQPIIWKAYVDKNTLTWEKDSVNIVLQEGQGIGFDVKINNKGGVAEDFYLEDLPNWLSTETLYGTVYPNKSQTIHFVVKDNVAVGTYNQMIGLAGNEGITESLLMNLKVKAQAPNWSVETSSSDSTMNVVAQVYINKRLHTSTESLLGAFVNDRCVGLVSPVYMESRDSYFAPLTIHGDGNTEGKKIELRFWDETTGLTYSNMKQTPVITFTQNAIMGNYDSPVRVENSSAMEQRVALKRGWNWISSYLKSDDNLLSDVMGKIGNNLSLIKTKTQFCQVNKGVFSGSLTTLEPKELYSVKATDAGSFIVYGSLLQGEQQEIAISPKWSWIGSTSPNILTLDEAFVGLNPEKDDIVKSMQKFAIYNGHHWEGNLTSITPGEGYKYFSSATEKKMFRFPMRSDNGTVSMARAKENGEPHYHFKPVDHSQYPDNMTIVAQVRNGAEVVDTLELAAFVGGECRATIRAIDGYYYLTVPGEGNNGTVEFHTILNGEEATMAETLPFRSDDMQGTPEAPFILNLDKATAISHLSASDAIQIAPLNTQRFVKVKAPSLIKRIAVYDNQGRQHICVTPNEFETELDLASLPSAMYTISVTLDNGTRRVEHLVRR